MDEEEKRQLENAKVEQNAEALKTVAVGAAGIYGGKVGAVAAKTIANTQVGQKVFHKAGEALNNVDNIVRRPLDMSKRNFSNYYGNPALLRNNNEEQSQNSELEGDMPSVNPESEDFQNKDSNAFNGNNAFNLFNRDKNKKNDKKDGNLLDKIGKINTKKLRIWALVGAASLMIFFLMVFVMFNGKDFAILGLSGNTSEKDGSSEQSDLSLRGGTPRTNRGIEQTLLYVGDNRMVEMQKYIQSTDVKFIAEPNANYNWLISKGNGLLKQQLNDDSAPRFVVIALGLYDMNNDIYMTANKYLDFINKLQEQYENNVFIFLSVTPVKEKLAPKYMKNLSITKFNNKMFTNLRLNYIDATIAVNENFETKDGIGYDGATYRGIHAIVVNYIKENFKFGFLDEYPDNKGTAILTTPLKETLGEETYEKINKEIAKNIKANGNCTPEGAAVAGITLAYELYKLGYRLPYYWNGGHDSSRDSILGVRPDFGTEVRPSTNGKGLTFYFLGFDCSGFVNWTIYQSVNNASNKVGNINKEVWGTPVSFENALPGDIMYNDIHNILIIGNKGDYLQTLESTSGGFGNTGLGLVFSKYTRAEVNMNNYKIIDLSKFYKHECGG